MDYPHSCLDLHHYSVVPPIYIFSRQKAVTDTLLDQIEIRCNEAKPQITIIHLLVKFLRIFD
jgi:hypothetical protein